MDIDNKTLVMFLIGAIIISILGTTISITKMNNLVYSKIPTGYASNVSSGIVNITISSELSIVLDNSTVNFGSCSLTSITYNASSNHTDVPTTNCTGGNLPEGIVIRNNGNVNANITMNSTEYGNKTAGGTLLRSGGSYDGAFHYDGTFYYTVENVSATGNDAGCHNFSGGNLGIPKDVWTEINSTNDYIICDNLSKNSAPQYTYTNSSVTVWYRFQIPANAQGTTNNATTVTFLGSPNTY